MANGQILQCFLNADLRCGHDGLASLAKKHDLNVTKLIPGQYVVFINSARNRLKVYAASNVIAYLKLATGGRIDLNTVREIPRVFNGSGKIDYEEALRIAVNKSLAKKSRANGPLQAFKSMQTAGLV